MEGQHQRTAIPTVRVVAAADKTSFNRQLVQRLLVMAFIYALAYTLIWTLQSPRLTETGQPVIFTVVDSSDSEIDAPIINKSRIPLETSSIDLNTNRSISKEKELSPIDTTTQINTDKTQEPPYVVHAEPKIVVITAKEELLPNVLNSDVIDEDQHHEPTIETPSTLTQTDEPQKETEITSNSEPESSTNSPDEMPSFSEWSQKQLAEEQKSQALNESTGSSGQPAKILLKNFASPDCGAKIVGSNPEAKSASSVLSPSLDEYLLNTCTSRIWFIVELCEGIQAKRIELANFELFSSSPRNFTISVSDRFPTRDWRTVGQFEAKDERNVQNFPLTTHLYAKYVRFELLSHYGQEHFCPISLFRVFGTSEFEVLDTDTHSHSDEEDEDEEDESLINKVEDTTDQHESEKPQNLFGSARDAVLSIVKKAAQVLAKGGDQKITLAQNDNFCLTPSHIVVCNNCSESLYETVYSLLSCRTESIFHQLQIPFLMKGLRGSEICLRFGFDFTAHRIESAVPFRSNRSAYISALLPDAHIAALCNALAVLERKVVLNMSQASVNIPKSDQVNISEQDNESVPELPPNASVGLDEIHLTPISTCSSLITNGPKSESPVSTPSFIEPSYEKKSTLDINPTKTIADSLEIQNLEPKDETSLQDSIVMPTTKLLNHSEEASTPTHDIPSPSSSTTTSSSSPLLESDEDDLESLLDELTDLDQNAQAIPNGIPTASISSPPTITNQGSNNQQQTTTQSSPTSSTAQPQQKESVFMRLSNRIKTLERNMSLSGQYLEELSRRYKRQVEEMQRVVERTLATVGEELAKRAAELELEHEKRLAKLEAKLDKMSSIVEILREDNDSWPRKIIVSLQQTLLVAVEVCLIIAAICWCRGYGLARERHINLQNSEEYEQDGDNSSPQLQQLRRLQRRVSVAGVSELELQPYSIRQRRPSEEALNISGTYNDLLIKDSNESNNASSLVTSKAESKRRRKKRKEIQEANRRVSCPPEVNQKYYPSQQQVTMKSMPLPYSLSPPVIATSLITPSTSNATPTTSSPTFTQRRLSAPIFLKTALAAREARRGPVSAPIKSNVPPSTKLKSDNWEWYSSRKIVSNVPISSSSLTSEAFQETASSSFTTPISSPPTYTSPNGHSNDFGSDNSDTLSSDSRNKKQSGLKKIWKKIF